MEKEDLSVYNPDGSLLRTAQMRMVHILREVDVVCRRHNIDYFIVDGTLLGAVRHGGFIPWDDDLDIAVMAEDYKKLRRFLIEELPDDLAFQDVSTEPNMPLLFAKVRDRYSFFEEDFTSKIVEKGIYIDIFPKEYILSLKWKKKLDYIYGHCFRSFHNYYNMKEKVKSCLVFPFAWLLVWSTRFVTRLTSATTIANLYGQWSYKELAYNDVFPTKDIVFEGVVTRGPADPDAVLRKTFGNYMQVPPKDKRPQHAEKIEIYR